MEKKKKKKKSKKMSWCREFLENKDHFMASYFKPVLCTIDAIMILS